MLLEVTWSQTKGPKHADARLERQTIADDKENGQQGEGVHLRPCLPLSEKSPKPEPVALRFLLALTEVPAGQPVRAWGAPETGTTVIAPWVCPPGEENLLALGAAPRVRPFRPIWLRGWINVIHSGIRHTRVPRGKTHHPPQILNLIRPYLLCHRLFGADSYLA